MNGGMKITFLGLSITSSWGNGHATTYRGLMRELDRQGHDVLFLERDVPWYASSRDMPSPPFGRTELYSSLDELRDRFTDDVRNSDLVVVGSFVPEGVAVGRWVVQTAQGATAFYDIDTPVTMAKLAAGDHQYVCPDLIGRYHAYLSFSGGPLLRKIEQRYKCPRALPLYCSFDPEIYAPLEAEPRWRLGYLGTYSDDRQGTLHHLLIRAARRLPDERFVLAGAQYPDNIDWPDNVQRFEHLPPARHCEFYNAQNFTLNVTRAEMIRAGWSPSVRLFEAAACGTCIISDYWRGLETFFDIGREILVAGGTRQVTDYLRRIGPEQRRRIGMAARRRVMETHTAGHRARELVAHATAILDSRTRRAKVLNATA